MRDSPLRALTQKQRILWCSKSEWRIKQELVGRAAELRNPFLLSL